MKRSYPHYSLVPKDLRLNLEFRREMLWETANDGQFAGAVYKMCEEDLLFYMNTFCWTYDPRDTQIPKKPMITYEGFQDEAIDQLAYAIEKGFDVAWPKSRTMGASWMALGVFEAFWHFKYDLSFLLISRTADLVDKTGDPKSLFWKIDFIHANQPRWLLPPGRDAGADDPHRQKFHLENARTGSVMDGEATTGDAGRGDRRTGMLIDEHAAFEINDGFRVLRASRDTTKCRLFNSTPQGANNAFAEVVHKSAAHVFRMHWSKHPIYNRGLYKSEKQPDGSYRLMKLDDFRGVVEVRTRANPEPRRVLYPDNYDFILDGKLRSPWYDSECARCVSEQEIAQELDIDFLGSDYQFFPQEFIQNLISEYCSRPMMRGRLRYDPDTLEPEGFMVDERGPLALWFNLDGAEGLLRDRKPMLNRQFVVGTDVSFGTGASNSVDSVVDAETGRKVAVWIDSSTAPRDFADETIALCKWFNNAFLIHDASGAAGRTFTKRVLEKRYSRIYYRKSEERTRARITDQPGMFLTSAADRAVLLQDYRSKLEDREFINVSESGMLECLQFIVTPGGNVEHSKAVASQDPRGAREAHGDETIADALAAKGMTMKRVERESKPKEAPFMSIQWRLDREKEEAEKAQNVDW